MRPQRLRLQTRISLLILLSIAPAWLTAVVFLWYWEALTALRFGLFLLITLVALVAGISIRRHVVRPLQSLANMLEALREGDYSLRGRTVDPTDALGEVMVEVNTLSRTLHDQRLEALEAGVLLEKIIADVDIAVFAFDLERQLRLVNRAGAALLNQSVSDLRGKHAQELGLASILDAESGQIVSHVFPTRSGRWETRRRSFREGGRPHELLVMTDVSRALREEERNAWQRLVRVIGHELNSSLTPIKSMAGTLRKVVTRDPLAVDWQTDAAAGLEIIHDRADALGRFMGEYARLARLPRPTPRLTRISSLVRRAVSLFDSRVQTADSEDAKVTIDPDQIEQVLINIIKNALEAIENEGVVKIRWHRSSDRLVIEVEDNGPGLAGTDNLWVPFFTTKPHGTGLGLVLSRDIVENHGGQIGLENRADGTGCLARIALPLDMDE